MGNNIQNLTTAERHRRMINEFTQLQKQMQDLVREEFEEGREVKDTYLNLKGFRSDYPRVHDDTEVGVVTLTGHTFASAYTGYEKLPRYQYQNELQKESDRLCYHIVTHLGMKYKVGIRTVINRIQQINYEFLIDSGFIPLTPFAQSKKYPHNGIMELLWLPLSTEEVNAIEKNVEIDDMQPASLFANKLPIGSKSVGGKEPLYKKPKLKKGYDPEKVLRKLKVISS